MVKLNPWQKTGAAWLPLAPIRLLADEQGLGKTAQVIEAARRLKLKRILIVCPKSARHMWLEEWARFWPADRPNIVQLKKLRDDIPDSGHVVCTYDYARECYSDLFIQGPWDCLVIDEFHEIRGTDARRTWAILHPTEGLVKRARRLWALTGTPIANHVGELYPLLKLAGIYGGSLDAFVRRYCKVYFDQNRNELKIVGVNEKNLGELHKMLDDSGIMLRRLKKGPNGVMPDLPPMVYDQVEIQKGEVDLEALFPEWAMGDRMRELVEKVEYQRAQAWNQMEGMAGLTFAQAVDQLAGLAGSMPELLLLTGVQKVAAVAKLVGEELRAGLYPKIFLITRHTVVGEGLLHGLREFGAVRLYGGTSADQRRELIQRFTEDDLCRVFIGQVRACGPAVNLCARGACWEVGVVEQSAVPGENSQAHARPHRIGCTHEVRVRLFKLKDCPVDRRWDELVFDKSTHIAKTMREDMLMSKEFDPIG